MAQIICIEGNIGSGKSTFVQFLKQYYKDRNDICFLDEPVDLWVTCKDNEGNILEHYYKDQLAYGFKFQMLAYISRLSILKKAIENKQYKYIISERSLYTDRNVFCKMLYDDKLIDEIGYQIYDMWFDEFNVMCQNTKYVYLKTLPETSYNRVMKRARKGETIPLEYLAKCSDYHDNWLLNPELNNNLLALVDANIDEKDTHKWTEEIDKIISPEETTELKEDLIISKAMTYLKKYIRDNYKNDGLERWIDEHFNDDGSTVVHTFTIQNLKYLSDVLEYCKKFHEKYDIHENNMSSNNICENFLFYVILENKNELFKK